MYTLQDLCINKIINHFDRYFLAFSKSKDANFKRKFEFLQRVYSFQIASELYNLGRMKDNYLDFVVNRYLKVLHTKWFKDCPWKIVAAKFAEVGSNIQKITFHECSEKMPFQHVIHHLTNLEVMNFPYHCTDEILKGIAQFCHNIMKINIQSSIRVTDEGIKSLCMKKDGKQLCPNLKEMNFSGCIYLEEGVKYLVKDLRSLEITDYLHLPQLLYSLHKNDLPSNDNVEPYNFTSLNISSDVSFNDDDILKVCLPLCPRLKSLSCMIRNNEQIVDLLHSSCELETLYIECFLNTEVNLNDLLKSKGKKLTSLSIISCYLTASCSFSISTLCKSCPNLKHLNLREILFENDDDIIPFFRCLESCIFVGIVYDSAAFQSISLLLKKSPKLEYIGFTRSDLTLSDLKTNILRWCEHCSIKKVNLTYSRLDVNFVTDMLLRCRSLNCLMLNDLSSEEHQQIIELATILPNSPEILIDDEVMSAIDSENDEIYVIDSDDFEISTIDSEEYDEISTIDIEDELSEMFEAYIDDTISESFDSDDYVESEDSDD